MSFYSKCGQEFQMKMAARFAMFVMSLPRERGEFRVSCCMPELRGACSGLRSITYFNLLIDEP